MRKKLKAPQNDDIEINNWKANKNIENYLHSEEPIKTAEIANGKENVVPFGGDTAHRLRGTNTWSRKKDKLTRRVDRHTFKWG